MDDSEKLPGLESLPSNFPYPWCSDYGEDAYGIFMAFTYEGVRQGFRWIPPGTFWMGSPTYEEGRSAGDDQQWQEIQNRVTLTKGYWLAETTCAQALWHAVMRDNPSEFKGEDRPVERVSWDDSQRFIEVLNLRQPELDLRLPSEAEWERACRAGTQTAYWFGGLPDHARLHFNQNFENGTLPVMALEPNPYGLYQMHGNVWEWCGDWVAAYSKFAVSDPQGPPGGKVRVLRGGSWSSSGRSCRSANRFGLAPDLALNFLSFRLARGQ